MQTYEVEIKSLLGTSERADELRSALKKVDPSTALTSSNRQLNHYFEGPALDVLSHNLAPHLDETKREQLADICARATSFSVRTRDKDGTVLIVVKASVGDDTSANGVARMEFEAEMPLTINELDEVVLQSGFSYQAKWSREREEYLTRGINVCLDKNAGYGYLAEFERVVDDQSKVADAEKEVRALMAEVGSEELPQDRLERMFAFYNTHWPEYYGTDKIFNVD